MSILFPAVISVLTTLFMYIGEMIFLNGNLYRFGSGFFFDALGVFVLDPVDLFIILISRGITALICKAVGRNTKT